jgi:hypothetical protein
MFSSDSTPMYNSPSGGVPPVGGLSGAEYRESQRRRTVLGGREEEQRGSVLGGQDVQRT